MAGACIAATWVPLLSLFVVRAYALGYWSVLAAYLGLSWLAPGVLIGVAAAGLARERGRAKPNRVGVTTGIAATALLLVAVATGLTAVANEWSDETAEVAPQPTPVVPTPVSAPEDIVREAAVGSQAIEDVLCSPISETAAFCAVTFEGPACQLWAVTDGEPEPILDAIEDARGTRTSGGVRCGAAEPPVEESIAGGGAPLSGKDVFLVGAGCGACHALADAGTTGTTGPDLDATLPSYELVLDRVTNGRGGMPSFTGVLTDEQIRDVAAYVSQVAGS
jgi:mono/diheme cytochrome c family protein